MTRRLAIRRAASRGTLDRVEVTLRGERLPDFTPGNVADAASLWRECWHYARHYELPDGAAQAAFVAAANAIDHAAGVHRCRPGSLRRDDLEARLAGRDLEAEAREEEG